MINEETYNIILSKSSNKNLKKSNIFNSIKKIIPFYNFLTALYFLLHIPYFFGTRKNYAYFKENFLMRKIFYLKNLYTKNYINLNQHMQDKVYKK